MTSPGTGAGGTPGPLPYLTNPVAGDTIPNPFGSNGAPLTDVALPRRFHVRNTRPAVTSYLGQVTYGGDGDLGIIQWDYAVGADVQFDAPLNKTRVNPAATPLTHEPQYGTAIDAGAQGTTEPEFLVSVFGDAVAATFAWGLLPPFYDKIIDSLSSQAAVASALHQYVVGQVYAGRPGVVTNPGVIPSHQFNGNVHDGDVLFGWAFPGNGLTPYGNAYDPNPPANKAPTTAAPFVANLVRQAEVQTSVTNLAGDLVALGSGKAGPAGFLLVDSLNRALSLTVGPALVAAYNTVAMALNSNVIVQDPLAYLTGFLGGGVSSVQGLIDLVNQTAASLMAQVGPLVDQESQQVQSILDSTYQSVLSALGTYGATVQGVLTQAQQQAAALQAQAQAAAAAAAAQGQSALTAALTDAMGRAAVLTAQVQGVLDGAGPALMAAAATGVGILAQQAAVVTSQLQDRPLFYGALQSPIVVTSPTDVIVIPAGGLIVTAD